MKVLLVNPYIYDFTAYDFWLRPLGLLYIASILEKYTDSELYWLDTLDRFQENAFPKAGSHGKKAKSSGRGKYHREIVDKPAVYNQVPRFYSRFGMPYDAFREKMENLPDVDIIFVTSLMTYWHEGCRFTIDALRKRFPNARIVLGGLLPTLVPHDLLRLHVEADIYVEGYGESKVLDIVAAEGGTVHAHPDFSQIANLPTPAVQFLSNRKTLPLMTSRGCPMHCTYCASDIVNPGFFERSAAHISAEILHMRETFGTEHFVIFDDALLINKRKRFFEVFRPLIDVPGLSFHTPNGLHAGEIDIETAQIMFRSGFKTLRLSFESTNSDILSRSSHKVTVDKMVRAVENLEAVGYRRRDLGVYLLFGLPGQRLADINKALDFVRDLGVSPNLSYYSPVPRTRDFLSLQESGLLSSPLDLYQTNNIYFIYTKTGFSVEEIVDVKDRASQIGADIRKS
ncbi:MAG: radical SAM protein [bacterium]|nr:radical SAM protein [bacterium]